MADYDRRYIEWLKEQDPATLTPEQRRLRNLSPIKNGEVRNPAGGKKGVKHWSTHFRKLLEDEDFFKTFISGVPKEWEGIVDNSAAKAIAAAVITSTSRRCMECLAKKEPLDRDTREMVALLNKLGYGDKVVIEDVNGDSPFNRPALYFDVIPSKKSENDNAEQPEDNN